MMSLVTGLLAKIGISATVRQVKMVFVGIAALAVLGIVGASYLHYNGLLRKISNLEKDNAQLETTVIVQGNTIDAQRDALGEWSDHSAALVRQMEELANVTRSANAEARRLNELFREHDLGSLASNKPGLIERRVNDASDDARRMLECASGATGTDC